MTVHRTFPSLLLVSALVGCESRLATSELIFIDGRAVAPVSDSIYAYTALGQPGVLLHYRESGVLDTLGAEELSSPVQTQWVDGLWYVSDVVDGRPLIMVFDSDGEVTDRVDLGGIASALLLVTRVMKRDSKFAYGPYLIVGAWVAILWGEQILDWYLR